MGQWLYVLNFWFEQGRLGGLVSANAADQVSRMLHRSVIFTAVSAPIASPCETQHCEPSVLQPPSEICGCVVWLAVSSDGQGRLLYPDRLVVSLEETRCRRTSHGAHDQFHRPARPRSNILCRDAFSLCSACVFASSIFPIAGFLGQSLAMSILSLGIQNSKNTRSK